MYVCMCRNERWERMHVGEGEGEEMRKGSVCNA